MTRVGQAARLGRGDPVQVPVEEAFSETVVFQEGDLAVLLRAVKLWAGDSALDAIGYHVDGREHVLESGTAAWRTAA